jgi:hypothetical protein
MQQCYELGYTVTECLSISSAGSPVGPLILLAIFAVGAWLMRR